MRVQSVQLSSIRTDYIENCRSENDGISELVESIKSTGLQIPLGVVELGEDDYGLVYGFRRYAALTEIGATSVAVKIVESSDTTDLYVINLQENVARSSLNPMEEARALKKIIDLGRDLEECRAALGWSKTICTQRLSLLDLSQKVQEALSDNKLSIKQARIVDEADEAHQDALIRLAEQGATVKSLLDESEILHDITREDPEERLELSDDEFELPVDDDEDEDFLEDIANDERKVLKEAEANLVKSTLLDCGAKAIKDSKAYFAFQVAVNCVEFDKLPDTQLAALVNAVNTLAGEFGLDAWGEAVHR